MKTAIYIEDGRTQFVLTPETQIDQFVLAEMESTELKTYRGSFYACQGGWTRQKTDWIDHSGVFRTSDDRSLIFVIDKKVEVEPPPKPRGDCEICGPGKGHS